MLFLDTDHLSLLMWRTGIEAHRIETRLNDAGQKDIVTTIITYEEQSRGWLSVSSKARSAEEMVVAYGRLKRHLDGFSKLTVLEFDRGASNIFLDLKRAKIRVGTMDLKIAAIAISREATLLSRNLGDFRKVSGLRAEDWCE